MPDNRRGQRNGGVLSSSNPSVHSIEEGIRRVRIQRNGNQEGGAMAHSSSYPDRPGEPDCIYYLRTGMCGYGSNCRFNHPAYTGQVRQYEGELPERVGEPDCVYYLKTGACKYGSTCKYNHPRDRHGAGPLLLNVLGLPMRKEEKPCPHYLRTGSCKFGVACKFHHPQPNGTDLAPPASGGYVSASSVSGPTFVGGVPAWSLPRTTYISPVVISPSQGMLPAHAWNIYTGSLSPVSSPTILGASASIEQAYALSPFSHLPERPGQPECRYFMNTGNCKYGSDCKYHHPREKGAQFAASSVGPLGLPLRPGQAVCSYYSLYGLCKYGPTCRFDHPMVCYPYSYSLGLPNMPLFDPALFHNGRNSPVLHSSESSPTKSSKTRFEAASKENEGSPSQSPDASSEPAHDQSD